MFAASAAEQTGTAAIIAAIGTIILGVLAFVRGILNDRVALRRAQEQQGRPAVIPAPSGTEAGELYDRLVRSLQQEVDRSARALETERDEHEVTRTQRNYWQDQATMFARKLSQYEAVEAPSPPADPTGSPSASPSWPLPE